MGSRWVRFSLAASAAKGAFAGIVPPHMRTTFLSGRQLPAENRKVFRLSAKLLVHPSSALKKLLDEG